ncbi:hypothetical protein DW743_13515 [Blautia sp. AM28-27]|nr:hypothetical protein DW746_13750 [Blautia sp. AM28-36]RHS49045.1 hypothetical protein DW965_02760 [Blautia sp. AM47-4]RHT61886.1 hypothetical protein DW743_13515 [Blautia sp. AM28-27]RHT80184.1 hypothetical protein DW731_13005 [Blautia sp. AM28-10]
MALSKKKKDEIPDSKAQKTTLCRREFLRPPSGGGFAKIALHSRNGKTIMGLRRFKKLGPEEVQK